MNEHDYTQGYSNTFAWTECPSIKNGERFMAYHERCEDRTATLRVLNFESKRMGDRRMVPLDTLTMDSQPIPVCAVNVPLANRSLPEPPRPGIEATSACNIGRTLHRNWKRGLDFHRLSVEWPADAGFDDQARIVTALLHPMYYRAEAIYETRQDLILWDGKWSAAISPELILFNNGYDIPSRFSADWAFLSWTGRPVGGVYLRDNKAVLAGEFEFLVPKLEDHFLGGVDVR